MKFSYERIPKLAQAKKAHFKLTYLIFQVHEISDTDEESDNKEDSCLLGTRKSSIDSQNFLDMSSSQELLWKSKEYQKE